MMMGVEVVAPPYTVTAASLYRRVETRTSLNQRFVRVNCRLAEVHMAGILPLLFSHVLLFRAQSTPAYPCLYLPSFAATTVMRARAASLASMGWLHDPAAIRDCYRPGTGRRILV